MANVDASGVHTIDHLVHTCTLLCAVQQLKIGLIYYIKLLSLCHLTQSSSQAQLVRTYYCR